ncbi:carbohydrate ABC transporter permease [Pseudolysinimonas sp.]|uniref:carbohydrate ABC transporter permease n=1 Tax=Pseudolysinimonas sp. TaxID=2680009 RepID=UPI003F7DB4E4
MSAVATARPAGTATRAKGRKRKALARDDRRSTLLTIVMWLAAAYFLLPLVWLLISATKSTGDLFSTFGYWFAPHFGLWDNIVRTFTYEDGAFGRWILNTILYAGAGSIGATILSTMAGYAFAKYDFPGGKAIFSVVLGSIMIPLTALAIPTYLLFSGAGLTDTPAAVIIPSLISPFGVYLMRVYAADSVPDSILEAARMDGAGEFRIFLQVALRQLGPGVVTVFLFALVATWNNYFLPLIMLNSSQYFPLTVGLAHWQATATNPSGGNTPLFDIVITGSVISVLPLVAAFLYLQRYWQSGLGTGAVKG